MPRPATLSRGPPMDAAPFMALAMSGVEGAKMPRLAATL
jgi:hypothetical protein